MLAVPQGGPKKATVREDLLIAVSTSALATPWPWASAKFISRHLAFCLCLLPFQSMEWVVQPRSLAAADSAADPANSSMKFTGFVMLWACRRAGTGLARLVWCAAGAKPGLSHCMFLLWFAHGCGLS